MKSQLSSLQHKQTFLRLMIFTLVTVMIWVSITLFSTQRETGIKPELLVLAETLNPNINTQVLERVEQKRYFSPEELADFPIYALDSSSVGEGNTVVVNAVDKAAASNNQDEPTNISPDGQPAESTPQPTAPTEDTQAPPSGTETPSQEQPQPEQGSPAQPNQFQEGVQLDSPTGE